MSISTLPVVMVTFPVVVVELSSSPVVELVTVDPIVELLVALLVLDPVVLLVLEEVLPIVELVLLVVDVVLVVALVVEVLVLVTTMNSLHKKLFIIYIDRIHSHTHCLHLCNYKLQYHLE